MPNTNWEKVKEILDEVLQIEPAKRLTFLRNAEISDEIKAEIESLIAFEEDAENLMNLSAIEFSKDFFAEEEASNALIGQQFGVYKIIREIGYGGMGAVYLAERNDGKFEQKVALKLLKREMNTSAIRRRFQQEGEILAYLEHPNIARLLDAGTTDDKSPYLAMEFVEGVPIDEYCHKHNLNLNERLDLFRQVCSAVNFAHRNLVVHRDLKPSNILVTNDGIPKLLDFGISKILSTDFEQANSATVTRLGAMTPSYASPEQLQRRSVTTATDIYSLGVILYELLSGHRPFEEKEENLKDIVQAVLDTDPPLPSWVLEKKSKQLKTFSEKEVSLPQMTDEQSTLAFGQEINKTQNVKTIHTRPEPQYLTSSSLRGDLDNIILKALRKEPERRYSSAENFAEDLHRYQKGLPVTARPNTFSYRAEKFIRRNRIAVSIGGLLILAVISGVIGTIWQSRIAAAERDRARLEAEKAKKINAYMQNILNFSNPNWLSSNPQRNREAKIADAMDESLKNIDTDLADEPEIQAEIMYTLAHTYTNQGQYNKAEPLLRRAIENFNQVSGGENFKAMQASLILGDICYYGKADYKEAEQHYTEAVNYFSANVHKDKTQTKWLAIALNQRGNVQVMNANSKVGIELYKQSLELSKDFTGKDRFIIPVVASNLGILTTYKGDYETALNYFQQALEEIRREGNESTMESGGVYSSLGYTLSEKGDYQQAEINLKKASDIYLKTIGEEHYYTSSMRRYSALNYFRMGKFDEAEKLANKNLQIMNKLFPKGHSQVALTENVLGEIYTKSGDLKKGETFLRKALEWFLKNTKDFNHNINMSKRLLGENLLAQRRYPEAREMLLAAIEGTINNLGENSPSLKPYRELLSKIPE